MGATAIKRELPDSALGYTMDHSGFIYVIDAAGSWREVFSHGAAIKDITSDLRHLIRTGAS
jgi:protein SCO1/2